MYEDIKDGTKQDYDEIRKLVIMYTLQEHYKVQSNILKCQLCDYEQNREIRNNVSVKYIISAN